MNKILLRKPFLIIFFVLANLVFWGGMFFGLDFTDSFFHINAARTPEVEDFFSSFFLSSIFISFIEKFLGGDLIIFRLVNSFLLFCSVFLPFLFGKQSVNRINLFYISCVLLLISPLNVNILGYDTFSVFFISLFFSAYLKYFVSDKKKYWISVLSFLVTLTVFIRLPNIIIVPILFGFLLIYDNKKYAFTFLIFTALFTYCGYYLVYRNLESFIDSLYGAKNHSVFKLTIAYFKDALSIIFYGIFIGYIHFIYQRWKGLGGIYRKSLFFLLISFFVLFFISFSGYWRNYSLFITALVITWIGFTLYKVKGISTGDKIFSRIFIVLLFVIPFGSNTGLLKASLILVIFPFIISRFENEQISIFKLILIILLPFSLLENFSKTYEDSSILEVTHPTNLDRLDPIMTTKLRSDYIQSINKEMDSLERAGFEIVFYGNKSHMFNYLYPSQYYSTEFNQPLNDFSFFQKIKKKKGFSKTALFLIDNYPEVKDENWNAVENELYDQGFLRKQNEFSFYYFKY